MPTDPFQTNYPIAAFCPWVRDFQYDYVAQLDPKSFYLNLRDFYHFEILTGGRVNDRGSYEILRHDSQDWIHLVASIPRVCSDEPGARYRFRDYNYILLSPGDEESTTLSDDCRRRLSLAQRSLDNIMYLVVCDRLIQARNPKWKLSTDDDNGWEFRILNRLLPHLPSVFNLLPVDLSKPVEEQITDYETLYERMIGLIIEVALLDFSENPNGGLQDNLRLMGWISTMQDFRYYLHSLHGEHFSGTDDLQETITKLHSMRRELAFRFVRRIENCVLPSVDSENFRHLITIHENQRLFKKDNNPSVRSSVLVDLNRDTSDLSEEFLWAIDRTIFYLEKLYFNPVPYSVRVEREENVYHLKIVKETR